MSLPQVGTRLSYGSNIGTVRFVGEVGGSKGTWIGVEWDDPKRGKHSGNKDGRQVPNSGSFIRPNATTINYGQSFLQALSSKYIESQMNDPIEKVTLGSSNGTIEVEAVGLNKIRDKLSRLDSLREVSLDSELVAQTDDPSEITRICPRLDISNNLLTSWTDVARITQGLPRLEILSLNQTRLRFAIDASFATVFRGIKELRLNGSSIAWSEVLQLLPYFSSLCHLELGYNQMQTVIPSDGDIPNLTTLNLEHNALTEWKNVMQSLSMFTSLERLILSGNPLGDITLNPDESHTLSIKHLSLKSTGLTSWSSMDALSSWLPRLQALNVGSNPLFQVYGKPSELGQELADTLKKRLVDIECFKIPQSPSDIGFQKQTPPDVKISILPSMNLNVFRLKLLKTLKRTPTSNLKLWLILERDNLRHFAALDDMSRTLAWLGMDENCRVLFSIE
ncbi:hypothetical protein Clacol_007357 [Clathrus columnatus]|uniref:CAP-Gly domain-containing protein n=1 Tax=Clathrus columnatus TaxID=1419009 RepID=A0AAV5AHI2_9AGAM|nr:hypothetical protein Clacol_007357 [Clathrus columnatus]